MGFVIWVAVVAVALTNVVAEGALWARSTKNPDESTGSLPRLSTRSLAPLSLIRLLRTARFTRTLRCARSLACLLVETWIIRWHIFLFFSVLSHSGVVTLTFQVVYLLFVFVIHQVLLHVEKVLADFGDCVGPFGICLLELLLQSRDEQIVLSRLIHHLT